MADEKVLDIDMMSDEDFMKLDPSQMGEVTPKQEEEKAEEPSVVENTEDADEGESDTEDKSESESESESEIPESKSEEIDSKLTKEEASIIPKGKDEQPTESDPVKKPEEKAKTSDLGTDQVKPSKTDSKVAIDFFEKVSAPFKADGRDMQIRTPEDVIRLMQMGVNYSRRMQEMKPLRAQDQMLKTNGLNDPEKLNFLIDLSKGDKGAIKKLLKDHKIDPIDIDTSSDDTPYRARNYQADPKDVAFDDAIKETLAAEGGRELINDINRDWDSTSKEALRDQPEIFQNILAQKHSGVYGKVKKELEYQRTMGYLTTVPFLSAYHQVAEAMKKAGVFDPKPQVQPKSLGTGTRKAAPKPNIEQPTPNVSSATPPRSVSTNVGGHDNKPDYSSMSDEDFLKLAPPG